MKTLFRSIGWLFKSLWRVINFVRIALTNLFFFGLVALIYLAFHFSSPSESNPITKQSALVLNLSGPIVEQSRFINPASSLTRSLMGDELPQENVLWDVVSTLRHAKDDESISGLVLSLHDLPETNLTKLRYIAKAINEFKASGKPVYAVGDNYNQSQYYLASYADKVYLSSDGGVYLKGYKAYSLFYKSLLEKLDVSTHVFRVGTYKSAVEPFLRDDMSPEAKQASTRWVGQLWDGYVQDVSHNRQIDEQQLNPSMDEFLADFANAKGSLAELAMSKGLVDQLATRQEVRHQLAQQFGSNGKDSYQAIGYYQYKSTIAEPTPHSKRVAVIVASGAIVDGTQPAGQVGGDTLANRLRKAKNDDDIKAVVLRVDSPGGSAFASEVIRNEILALKQAGKPVVVSMSSLAASGGYWISMSADKIIAQPTTLTGSIGIFSVITTFEKGLNKLGVFTDGVGTSPFSGDGLTQGLSEGAQQAMQLAINHGYQRFTQLVSDNRQLPMADMDAIAEGRVWTGQDALQRGLVDQIGDFDDAINQAAQLAELTDGDYSVDFMKTPLSTTERLLQQLVLSVSAHIGVSVQSWVPDALVSPLTQISQDAQLLSQFNDPKGIYTYCLNCQVK
ncbi:MULTISPECIES: signal peptide peptidase SppA [unclassified Vibrio]|uniref:Signal peptide peptidase SppA n=1 Tax=Vibrio sp. HB236076 TaxID=3232307 RepID=A0AB39HDA8_9VIBR|nr:signal peptide peptidase SppA [Vibrio sp. HB161653]MDP5254707.1 signal peptide peptidase SppA [Vibrio sp. HB161653]